MNLLTLNKPIMLCGLGHSGTSMIKRLLDGHPDLYVIPPNELHFFRNLDVPNFRVGFSNKYRTSKMLKSGFQTDMEKNKEYFCYKHNYINRLKDMEGFDLKKFKEILSSIEVKNIKELYIALMKSFALSSINFDKSKVETIRYVVKSTFDEEYSLFFLQMFPDGKIVYILRNPYAYIVSARRNFMKAYKNYPSLHSFLLTMRVSYYWMEYLKRLLHPEKFYILTYDLLLKNPEPEISKLANFLEIEVTPSLFYQSILGKKFMDIVALKKLWMRR